MQKRRKQSKHTSTENHQKTKEGSTGEGTTKQPENSKQNDNCKSIPINNHFKCK